MIVIEKQSGTDFLQVHRLSGEIAGIVPHPAHLYKIMADHFGDTFFVAKDVAEDGEYEILGFMMGFISRKVPGHLFVWQVAVSEEFQGKGIATKLLEHTIDYAKRSDECEAVMATVETGNTASQRLFETVGFHIDSGRFRGEGQELITRKGKEAVRDYYQSGTDQIFYVTTTR